MCLSLSSVFLVDKGQVLQSGIGPLFRQNMFFEQKAEKRKKKPEK